METVKPDHLNEIKDGISLQEYERINIMTDRFSLEEINPIILGLFGEVGSIMAASKKYRREKEAYPSYKEAVKEEFGDALWYLSALCRRLGFKLAEVFDTASSGTGIKVLSTNDQENAPNFHFIDPAKVESLDSILIELGTTAARLMKIEKNSPSAHGDFIQFLILYLQAMHTTGLSFAEIVKKNQTKTIGRFTDPRKDTLPDFDCSFPDEEQIPRKFEIHITQRKNGKSYLKMNGVFIGSPLTDNITNPDGYRFHDVFHLAYAAILHWSPTFRSLIKQKRKSDSVIDEAQDGGRAIVIEEGLTAWLFSYSKDLNYFENQDSVSFDVLKAIQKFVQGYEVEQCPLKLWEDAILQGYSVFRKVLRNNGGIVVGDRKNRKISYRSLGE